MGLNEAWELAKTSGSIVGVVTFGWRVFDAWDAYRSRIQVRATQERDHQLDLLISYRAKGEHTGLTATVRALKPTSGEIALVPALHGRAYTVDHAVDVMVARETADRKVTAAMSLHPDQPGLFEIVAEMFTQDETPTVKVVIVLRSVATGRKVAVWKGAASAAARLD